MRLNTTCILIVPTSLSSFLALTSTLNQCQISVNFSKRYFLNNMSKIELLTLIHFVQIHFVHIIH